MGGVTMTNADRWRFQYAMGARTYDFVTALFESEDVRLIALVDLFVLVAQPIEGAVWHDPESPQLDEFLCQA